MSQKKKLQIFRTTKDAQKFLKNGAAVAIGNFDGFHYGHQCIIQNLIETAKAKKLKSALLSFDPHPVKVLAPEVAPKLINTLDQKIELLSQTDLDCVIFQKFDKQFAKIKPEKFFSSCLIKDLHAKYITVGYDFTFGENRSGTIETMELLAYKNKIDVDIVEAQMVNNMLVSSSVIRKLIFEGQLSQAGQLLTRPFYIDGKIIHGHSRGTALGIHTANLQTDNELIPSDGVYATMAQLGKKVYKAATNIGFNPTFDNLERSIETHIFDFDQDIFDKNMRLIFVEKLREEIKFATPTALVQQIKKDIEKAKEVLKNYN